MDTGSQDGVPSSLDAVMEATNAAKERTGIAPVKAAFSSVSALLATVRDPTINKQGYIDLESSCNDICEALDRGMNGGSDDLSGPRVLNRRTVTEIQKKIVKQGKRNGFSRLLRAKNDKETIAAWRVDLNRFLHVFNTELAIDTRIMVADIHRNVLPGQAGTSLLCSISPGELPPPPPGACFGRDELIEEIVGLTGSLCETADQTGSG